MNGIDNNSIITRGEFRGKLHAYCKQAGIKQATLARAVGFTPSRFSERLNGTKGEPFFNIPEVKAIVSYLDSQNAFYCDTEGLDLLHTVYPPKTPLAAPVSPVIASQAQAVPAEAVSHAQSEPLVFTATTTTTITTTITATTTFTANTLALPQTGLNGQLDRATSSSNLQTVASSEPAGLLNGANSDQEKALARELARLVLEYLSLDTSNSSASGRQEVVSIDVASQAEDIRAWL